MTLASCKGLWKATKTPTLLWFLQTTTLPFLLHDLHPESIQLFPTPPGLPSSDGKGLGRVGVFDSAAKILKMYSRLRKQVSR